MDIEEKKYLMRPTGHIVVSGALGVTVSAILHNPEAGIACLLAGVLVDLDHILDYKINTRNQYSRDSFWTNKHYFQTGSQAYVVFHSWELILVVWWILSQVGIYGIAMGCALGYAGHLLVDQFTNHAPLFGYFFFFRLYHGFQKVWK